MAIQPIKLTPEDKKRLEDLEPDLTALEEELIKAERAGLDISTVRSDFDKAKKLRDGILREYG